MEISRRWRWLVFPQGSAGVGMGGMRGPLYLSLGLTILWRNKSASDKMIEAGPIYQTSAGLPEDTLSSRSIEFEMSFPTLCFVVESSSTGELYQIKVARSDDNLTCTCTCPAAENGLHCKHRVGVLLGDASTVSGGDTDKMHLMPQMLAGTDVDLALRQVVDLEARKSDIDKQLKAAKKHLARALFD